MRLFIRCCIMLILGLLAATAALASNDSLQRARAALVSNPAMSVQLFQQQQPTLAAAPAWYQRDWYLVAARANTRLKQFAVAARLLQQTDALLDSGLTKSELLLTAGFVNVMQGRYQDAAYWYQCSRFVQVSPLEQSRVDMSLGLIATFSDDWPDAYRFYQQAFRSATLYQQQELLPLLHNDLGLIHWRMGHPDLALRSLKQAQYGYAKLQQDYSYLISSLNLLSVLVAQQQWPAYERAATTFRRTATQLNYPELLLYLDFLQQLYYDQHQGQAGSHAALVPLFDELQLPALRLTARALLHQFAADLPLKPEMPHPNAQQFTLPNLQQSCGPGLAIDP